MSSVRTDSRKTEAVPFSFANLERRTDDCMARVRAKAEQIAEETKADIMALRQRVEEELAQRESRLEERQSELDRRERQVDQRERASIEESRARGYETGRAEGFQAGHDEGIRQARGEMAEELRSERERQMSEATESILPALRSMAVQLQGVRQSLLSHWEKNILQIAAAIAYQAMGRRLPKTPELPLDLLRESLELAVGCVSVRVRMNPNDLAELRSKAESLLSEFSSVASAELTPDDQITAGGCVVETSHGVIDQRLESRLERIITELSE